MHLLVEEIQNIDNFTEGWGSIGASENYTEQVTILESHDLMVNRKNSLYEKLIFSVLNHGI